MTDRIGPTFPLEIAAAGLTAALSGWFADGTLVFAPGATDANKAAAAQVFAAHDPTKQLPPTVTGNQWAFALADLSLSSAWQVGVAKSKAKDQVRIGLIARDTPLFASDPLLARAAANAGTVDGTATGAPLIDVPTVFTRAQAMPL